MWHDITGERLRFELGEARTNRHAETAVSGRTREFMLSESVKVEVDYARGYRVRGVSSKYFVAAGENWFSNSMLPFKI